MKKSVCILIVFITVLSCFLAGCAEKRDADETKAPAKDTKQADAVTVADGTVTEASTDVPDGLPEENYKGREFRIITSSVSEVDIYTEDHMINDTVHDAVLTRNLNVQDRFGIKISVLVDSYENVTKAVKRAVKAGSDEYDLCFVHMVNGAALAQNNEVLPFEKLPYVDFSKPWWDSDIKNGFSIRNNLMMANGDISPTSFNYTSCLYFNKKIFEKLDLEDPYELVGKGEWTLDKFIEFTKDYTQDMDGDGKITHDSSRDVFGLTSYFLSVPYDFYYGAGGMLVSKDEDDVPFYDPHIERDTNIYEKIYKAIITNKANFETDEAYELNVIKIFTDGRAMFYNAMLSSCEFLREMDDDYGILPEPKYNISQSEYKSFVNGASSMICVPATVKPENREYVSVIIEALASEAYRVITPALKETYLKRKMTRDWQSSEMVDIIVRHRVFDMAYVNMWEGIGSFVRDLLRNKSTNVSSIFQKYSVQSQKKIEKIVRSFDETVEKYQ